MKQIQKINILHLTNAAHILFVRTAVGRAEACDALKTKATEELKALKKALEKEDELFVQSQKDLTTGPCTAAWTKKNFRRGHAPAAWTKKNFRRGRAPLHGPKRISDGSMHLLHGPKRISDGAAHRLHGRKRISDGAMHRLHGPKRISDEHKLLIFTIK